MLALLMAAAACSMASAQVREWTLVEPGLQRQTTIALQRYYTIVQPDSIRLRYLRTNVGSFPYRLRGSRGGDDSLGQLLSVSLGQLSLFSPQTLRIAFGEDLYRALLLSRTDSGADERIVYPGEGIWSNPYDPHTIALSLDRLDYRLTRSLGLFLQAGSPESNLPWWTDGTARLGVTNPAWEFAILFPFSAGATAVGPYRERLLAPGFGASARLTLGSFVARVRFTGVGDVSFSAPSTTSDRFVHTLSSQAFYNYPLGTGIGSFLLRGGIDYEEFAGVVKDADGTPTQTRRIRRLSPHVETIWSDQAENVTASLGMTSLALRAALAVRLTDALSLELRAVENELFRTPKPFEHPFIIFFTPRLRF